MHQPTAAQGEQLYHGMRVMLHVAPADSDLSHVKSQSEAQLHSESERPARGIGTCTEWRGCQKKRTSQEAAGQRKRRAHTRQSGGCRYYLGAQFCGPISSKGLLDSSFGRRLQLSQQRPAEAPQTGKAISHSCLQKHNKPNMVAP